MPRRTTISATAARSQAIGRGRRGLSRRSRPPAGSRCRAAPSRARPARRSDSSARPSSIFATCCSGRRTTWPGWSCWPSCCAWRTGPSEARVLYEAILARQPDHPEALAWLLHLKSIACDWHNRDAEVAQLLRITERQIAAGQRTGLSAFHAFALPVGAGDPSGDRPYLGGRDRAAGRARQGSGWISRSRAPPGIACGSPMSRRISATTRPAISFRASFAPTIAPPSRSSRSPTAPTTAATTAGGSRPKPSISSTWRR